MRVTGSPETTAEDSNLSCIRSSFGMIRALLVKFLYKPRLHIGGVEVELLLLLTLTLDGGEWLPLRSGSFTSGEGVPLPISIELEAGWAPELVWTFLERRKNVLPCRDSNPGLSNWN
jgi:hypothetical protein